MAEWSIAPDSKSGVPARVSGVRIPLSPSRRYVNEIVNFAQKAKDRNYFWRGDRVVEGARLEIVCTAKSGTEGSNPSLSASKILSWREFISYSNVLIEKFGCG